LPATYLSPDSFQHFDDVSAAEGEARLQRWREAREGVDDRQNAQPRPGCQLIVHEVHGPGLVRAGRIPPILAQLCLDPAFRRFVAQLQTQLAINATCPLLVDVPAFTT